MKTIRTKVYEFNELSNEAKQKAINDYRSNGIDVSYIYDEAHETVKEFNNLFGTKEGRNSWLDVSTEYINDDILSLTGLRLRTYLVNNFGYKLYKGKYFSLWSKTEKSYKHYKEGYPVLKSRYSKVIFDNECVLTGCCYDYSILQPVYDFIDAYKATSYNSNMDFDTLMKECLSELRKDVEDEAEAQSEDSNIAEAIIANSYLFTKDGRQFNC